MLFLTKKMFRINKDFMGWYLFYVQTKPIFPTERTENYNLDLQSRQYKCVSIGEKGIGEKGLEKKTNLLKLSMNL